MKFFLCVIEQTVTEFLHILDAVVVAFAGSLSTLPPGARDNCAGDSNRR